MHDCIGETRSINLFRYCFQNILLNTVDAKVVDGHVIPDHVIFLRAAEIGRQFKTAAFSSSLPVFVTFGKQEVNGKTECEEYIKRL